MIIHSYTTQGNRPYQEDRMVIKNNLIDANIAESETQNFSRYQMDLLAIFDGHGGPMISDTLSKSLPTYFYKQNIMSNNEPRPHPKYNEYIVSSFDYIQNELNAKHNKSSQQGSTVCMALIYNYKNKKYITTVWSGDSRAIACNKNFIAESLTLDHKPDSPLELARIKKLGGFVSFEANDVPRINGVLAVSRSMGDFDQKQCVEHKPDVLHYVCNNYKFIVVASDGLYDSMNNQQIVDFILNHISDHPSSIANSRNNKNELNIASKLALKAIELGSDDNVSIIIYFIDKDYI